MSKSKRKKCCNRNRTVAIARRKARPKHKKDCESVRPQQECESVSPHQVCETHEKAPKKWNALDPVQNHPFDETVIQDADAVLKNEQKSIESIVIKDSADVEVTTTDTQAALNVQAALQVAVALVISISIADSSQADAVTQDLLAKLKTSQTNKQQVYIENSRGVNVSTTDTDIAVNVQLLLQVLIALVVRLDIL
ncbi:spore coat protein [Aquibacillus sp. LR5S19]|uniref:Spore coat protein n=1 Tax=Aquibacillus rhizosphaerae TaxID=3051431 RepID=A0ABT7L1M4_9BACI|nr:spore coat protein [Aquibacillus sp. LR5S19]MDL4839754.1 spore coat protein [Aquibacillus sp. LR5S19]